MHNKDGSRTVADSAHRMGFLARLARDVRGNTLAIVGAALVPLSAMIGSGVDMSRAYMAQTRLQSACDAAALAGRRVMQDDTMTEAVRVEAIRFFNFNFRQGLYDTESFTPSVSRPDNGTVRVTASTRIPTTIMKMFGFETLPLNVTCDAALNFVNTDVMLVLDVTGSMDQTLAGTRKIDSLRAAVMALYDELEPVQEQLAANGLRLRYGVVPYSSTVNVGHLITAVNPEWIADSVQYQTRVPNYNTAVNTPVTTPIIVVEPGLALPPGVQRFQTNGVSRAISNANCTRFGNNNGFTQSGWTFTATGINNDADVYDPDGPAGFQGSAPAAPTPYVRYQFSRNTPTWSGSPTNRVCDRNVTVTRRTYTTTFTYTNDAFQQESVDTSQFKLNNIVRVAVDTDPTDSNQSTNNYDDNYAGEMPTQGPVNLVRLAANGNGAVGRVDTRWNGCIEERRTTSEINGSWGFTMPEQASDLDINGIPDSDETRWRPQWPELLWNRTSATDGYDVKTAACPREARRLQAWARADLLTYVNSLTPVGSTYHDVGMIWGARMISTGGIFSDGCEVFNAMPCARHIIFMTDGQMDTDSSIYGTYGIERLDQRISGMSNPSEAELNGRHRMRFQMMCNATRSQNTTVWVIAFGTALSQDMIDCATSENHASISANRDQLIARFREIGNNIGALRLTQ